MSFPEQKKGKGVVYKGGHVRTYTPLEGTRRTSRGFGGNESLFGALVRSVYNGYNLKSRVEDTRAVAAASTCERRFRRHTKGTDGWHVVWMYLMSIPKSQIGGRAWQMPHQIHSTIPKYNRA